MARPGSEASVLFVEDDADLRDVISAELELAGFHVVVAETGEEAMDVLREREGAIDWLFTDIRLPGLIDGWRVADEFRFSHPLRPVVFATGARGESPRDVNDSLFLRKPYRASDVVRAFRALRTGWGACPDEAEALRRLKSAPLDPRLSWSAA